MKFYSPGRCVLVSVVLATVTACGPASSEEAASGPAHSDLAPTFPPEPKARGAGGTASDVASRGAGDAAARRQAARDEEGRGSTDRGGGGGTGGGRSAPAPRGTAGTSPDAGAGAGSGDGRPGPASGPGTPGPVRVGDERGDLSVGTESPPASADILGVVLERTDDQVVVRTTFAGPVPTRQTGSKGMNVASFYDVDGNGYVDYEIWTSLADDGWGTGYLDDRRNEASFGSSTGIAVTVRGDTLVVSFPWDRIGGAQEFRWSAASEWGSYESMAASTSARDRAPDQGAVRYPG